jgi:putative transposase
VIPRHEFEAAAQRHHSGAKLRSITRWDQFLALSAAQLTSRTSLRDTVANFNAQFRRLYHLGAKTVARTSLSRVNRNQPASLFEEIFHKLLTRTQGSAPKHRFRFKAPLISLDASQIEMSLSLFPWAKYQATKGAIKLHVGLNHDGFLPQFLTVTDGKQHEVHWARALDLPAGSVVVFDRGFFDYKFFNQLNQNKIRFVTRLKRDISYTVIERREVAKDQGLTSDQIIRLSGKKALRYGLVLRRVGYRDPETGRQYFFLTNATDLAASTIAQVYRDRWQIELFFKWIKQNLKIKSFVGTTPNAVLTQIWIAMSVYLMLAYLKFLSAEGWSMSEIIRLLQLNLFQRRSLQDLLRPPDPRPPDPSPQLCLGMGW